MGQCTLFTHGLNIFVSWLECEKSYVDPIMRYVMSLLGVLAWDMDPRRWYGLQFI